MTEPNYRMETPAVLAQLDTTMQGLSEEEAVRRLDQYGPNQLSAKESPSLFRRFLDQLKNPMILILIAAALVSGVSAAYAGEPFTDVIIILTVVLINGILGVVQENKAEQALQALQDMTAPVSKVIRDGTRQTLDREKLVPGDILILEAGDTVPADARICESASLQSDESPLTGESVPVEKTSSALSGAPSAAIPLGDRTNMVYMGTTIVYGRGTAVVTQTGMATEMGKIADALASAEEELTPLQKKLNHLSRILSVLVLGICVFLLAFQLLRNRNTLTGPLFFDTFLTAVSLAVAAIPEGLAAVVTIVLSIGVTRMSRQHAIVRRLTAVEALGCAQIICSDKTGTLTQNRMTVAEHFGGSEALLAAAGSLASDAGPDSRSEITGEPTECALVAFAAGLGLEKPRLEQAAPRIGEAPFDSQRKRMSTLHRPAPDFALLFPELTPWLASQPLIQFTKGAPDEVLKHCTYIWKGAEETPSGPDPLLPPLTDAMRQEILQINHRFANKALRVLASAFRLYPERPADLCPETLEQDLCFLGLVGMIDPIRPEAKEAIRLCREAGIRPIMITGDHKDTAAAIAAELGILTSETEVITGSEMDRIPEGAWSDAVPRYAVYARVRPEHKVLIVRAWKSLGKVTAMTGDGVNDAPSIKSADIGIGMGMTGTDVTKNAADLILSDDNFATIVSAIREGRRIYSNIRKSIQFLLASNLAEVLAIFTAGLCGFTLLKPIHLLWINLITDSFPALALGMEAEERGLMQKPPRDPKESLFAGGVGFHIVFQGIAIMALTLSAYLTGRHLTGSGPAGITMAFLTLSMVEIFHAFNMRSLEHSLFRIKGHNPYLWGAMAASFLATAAILFVPPLARAFGFTPLPPAGYALSLLLAALILPLTEAGKWMQARMGKF